LTQKLNEIYGFQLNAWLNITYKQEIIHDYDPDGDNFSMAYNHEMIALPSSPVDPDYDLRVFLIDSVEFRNTNFLEPRLNGTAFPGGAIVNAGYPAANAPDPTPDQLCSTIAHEIGHYIIGLGHPDEGAGPAPLLIGPTFEGEPDPSNRIMCSGLKRVPGARLLVKGEWDAAEMWLKDNADVRFRRQNGLPGSTPTGNY
jgi:hypothetical protein